VICVRSEFGRGERHGSRDGTDAEDSAETHRNCSLCTSHPYASPLLRSPRSSRSASPGLSLFNLYPNFFNSRNAISGTINNSITIVTLSLNRVKDNFWWRMNVVSRFAFPTSFYELLLTKAGSVRCGLREGVHFVWIQQRCRLLQVIFS